MSLKVYEVWVHVTKVMPVRVVVEVTDEREVERVALAEAEKVPFGSRETGTHLQVVDQRQVE